MIKHFCDFCEAELKGEVKQQRVYAINFVEQKWELCDQCARDLDSAVEDMKARLSGERP